MVLKLTVKIHNEDTKVWEALEPHPVIKRRNDVDFSLENVFSPFETVSTPFYKCLTYFEVPATFPSLQLSDDMTSTRSTSASFMLLGSLTILSRTIIHFYRMEVEHLISQMIGQY